MFHWTVHLEAGPKRTVLAAVAVGDRLYSFGGHRNIADSDQIRVHVFNTVSLLWTEFPPVTTGHGGRPPEVPRMRYGHTAVLIEGIVYIWGGFTTYTREYCNVLYAFDVVTDRWFRPRSSGNVPGARCAHSACALGKVIYVFGGYNRLAGCTNNMYSLDTTAMVWSLINTRGTLPPVSLCHTATIIGTKMFVFGGQADEVEDHYNDLRVFDTETECWLRTPTPQLLPEERGGHSAFAYNGELYIFGGHNFRLSRTFQDLWKFNLETFSWSRVEPKGKGPGSWRSMMCSCMVGNLIVLFAGYGSEPNDMYVLDLSPSLKTLCKLAVNQYGLEQSGLPHDIRWELLSMTTISPASIEW